MASGARNPNGFVVASAGIGLGVRQQQLQTVAVAVVSGPTDGSIVTCARMNAGICQKQVYDSSMPIFGGVPNAVVVFGSGVPLAVGQ